MTSKETTNLNIRLSKKIYDQFTDYCKRNNTSKTEVMISHILSLLNINDSNDSNDCNNCNDRLTELEGKLTELEGKLEENQIKFFDNCNQAMATNLGEMENRLTNLIQMRVESLRCDISDDFTHKCDLPLTFVEKAMGLNFKVISERNYSQSMDFIESYCSDHRPLIETVDFLKSLVLDWEGGSDRTETETEAIPEVVETKPEAKKPKNRIGDLRKHFKVHHDYISSCLECFDSYIRPQHTPIICSWEVSLNGYHGKLFLSQSFDWSIESKEIENFPSDLDEFFSDNGIEKID
jgi:DNA-binding transcriptional MerR regulator